MITAATNGDTFDPRSVVWVFDEDDMRHLLAAVDRAFEGVPDLETTGLFEYAISGGSLNGGYPARVALMSVTLPKAEDDPDPTTWVLPLSHPESMWQGTWRRQLARVCEAFLDAKLPLVNQNIKFDARWVKAHTGLDLSPLIRWDNALSSRLLDETKSAKLKERVPEEFGVPPWNDFPLDKPGAAEQVPLLDLGLYAARDTYWTWRQAIRHRIRMHLMSGMDGVAPMEPLTPEEAEEARLGRLAVYSVMPSVAALTRTESLGMALDTDWVHAKLEANEKAVDEILTEDLLGRYEVEGEPSFAPTSHYFRAWAAKAVEAGDLQVAAMTKQGNPQWTKAVLLRQARRDGSSVAQSLLDYRRLTKQNEFLRSWLGYATPWGTVHASYNAGAAATGRGSSSDPNMQQVTRELRPAWIPRPGYVIGDFDLSQIELRVAAFLSRSVPMMDAYRQGLDLHRMLAAEFARCRLGEVTSDQRQQAKAGNFGLLFGMGAGGLMSYAETAYDVVLSFEEAQRMYVAFFRTWDGLAQWHARVIARAHQTGQVVSPVGRVRRLPEIMSGDDYKVSGAERIAINSPVQGFASDILLTALALVSGTVPGYPGCASPHGARVVGTVHDSMMVELPENRWKEAAEHVLGVMTSGVLKVLSRMGCDFDVPLAAEAKIGTRWGLSDLAVMEEDRSETWTRSTGKS